MNNLKLNVNIGLYSIFIISLFLKIRIYFMVMILIILFNLLFLDLKKIKKYQVYSLLLIIYVIFSWFYTPKYEMKNINTLKLILTFLYIFTFENSFRDLTIKNYIIFWKKLNKVLKILIILNFFQIVAIYTKKNISVFQILFLKNSSMAYIINFDNMCMFIGNENKNIWSTKLGIICIIYFFVEKYIIKKKLEKKIILLSLITIILILSRTGILFILAFFILVILQSMSFKKEKQFFILNILLFFVLGKSFYKKILRIDFNNFHDGGMTRLYNWNLFRLNYFKENYMFGVGLGGTKNFLIKYNTILADGHMHNVILNMLLELGIIGGILYFCVIVNIFFESRKYLKNKNLILFFPIFLVLMLQYIGYDNDIAAYFSLVLLISYSLNKEKIQYDNFISNCNNK